MRQEIFGLCSWYGFYAGSWAGAFVCGCHFTTKFQPYSYCKLILNGLEAEGLGEGEDGAKRKDGRNK